MKNKIAVGVLVCLLCSLLVGCAQNKEPQETSVSKNRESLVLWMCFETEQQKSAMDELVNEFNHVQEEYELTWEYQGPLSEFKRKLADGMISGDLPDMVILDTISMRQYMERGLFVNLTSYLKNSDGEASFYKESLESVKYHSKYYGIPFTTYNQALFYNQDYFNEVGVAAPRTWSEFIRTAQVLTSGERYGFAMPALTSEDVAIQLLPWALSLEGQGGLTRAGIEGAYEMLDTLISGQVLSKECINWSGNDVYRKFVNGECAMMLNRPSVVKELDQERIHYAVVDFPDIRSQVNLVLGDAIAVIRGGNEAGALAFADFFRQDKVMGNARQLYFGIPPSDALAQPILEKYEIYQPFIKGIADDSKLQIADFNNWKSFSDTLSDGAVSLITGNLTPEEASLNLETYLPME